MAKVKYIFVIVHVYLISKMCVLLLIVTYDKLEVHNAFLVNYMTVQRSAKTTL